MVKLKKCPSVFSVTPTILPTSNDEMFEEALSTIAQDLDVKNLDDPGRVMIIIISFQ